MTTLAANAIRKFELGDESDLPIIAADIIYEGAAVGDNASGYARPLVAGDPFRGFALRKCDNAAGAAGAKNVRVKRYGNIVLPITSAAITDVGKDVYASDDDTFTLTQSTNTRVGYVKRWISTGIVVVAFHENSGAVAEFTGTVTGTADGVLEDIAAAAAATAGGSTPTAAQVDAGIATAVAPIVTGLNLQVKELMTKINALARRQGY